MKRWLVVAVLLGLTCDSPDPGQLLYDLDTPFADDGAVQVLITVPAGYRVTDVAPLCEGCRVFQRTVSAQEIRAAVVGAIGDGPFIAVAVSDRREPSAVQVTVRAAAGADYTERATVDGYDLLPRR